MWYVVMECIQRCANNWKGFSALIITMVVIFYQKEKYNIGKYTYDFQEKKFNYAIGAKFCQKCKYCSRNHNLRIVIMFTAAHPQ